MTYILENLLKLRKVCIFSKVYTHTLNLLLLTLYFHIQRLEYFQVEINIIEDYLLSPDLIRNFSAIERDFIFNCKYLSLINHSRHNKVFLTAESFHNHIYFI